MRSGTLVLLTLIIWLPVTGVEWDPIRETDLAVREPRIDADADAEAIFWRVWVTDRMLNNQQPQTVKEQYVRIKIFTDRGVEEQTTIDLFSASGGIRIADLRARTIKPDGRVVNLQKTAVFDRVVVKANGVKVRNRSFSMPDVEPGDIIEYQWKQYRDDHFSEYSRLHFQRDIPSWEVSYHIKPSEFAWTRLRYSMGIQAFNVNTGGLLETPGGFNSLVLRDVPAFRPEARMPPEDHVRSWMLLFYSQGTELKKDKYWTSLGKALYKEIKQGTKVDSAVKKKPPS